MDLIYLIRRLHVWNSLCSELTGIRLAIAPRLRICRRGRVAALLADRLFHQSLPSSDSFRRRFAVDDHHL